MRHLAALRRKDPSQRTKNTGSWKERLGPYDVCHMKQHADLTEAEMEAIIQAIGDSEILYEGAENDELDRSGWDKKQRKARDTAYEKITRALTWVKP